MFTIKIKIGFDDKQIRKKREIGIKSAVWIVAFSDSAVWLLDTLFLLWLFDTVPLYPMGFCFMAGILFLYFIYLMIKKRFLRKKYGRKRCEEEFGHMGVLLAAVGAVLVFAKAMLTF